MKLLLFFACLGFLHGQTLTPHVMDPKATPSLEVATVKASNPDDRPENWGINVDASGTLTTRDTTFFDLLKFTYDVHPKQVVGAPAWFDTDKFDLKGKPDKPGIPNVKQAQAMFRELLAERFGLTFHKDTRELTAYAITVAKGGERIKEDEDTTIPGFGGRPQGGFKVTNGTMAEFASVVQGQFLDQPVVDQTGFGEKRYSFVVKFTPDPGPGAPVPDADAPPDIFAAMEQQLGLHIQKTKARVEVMVIDKVAKPTDN